MTQKLHTTPAVTMSLTMLIAALACGVQKQEELKKQEEPAVTVAKTWLELVDQGEYEKSWETAAELFKNNIPKNEWTRTIAAGREPMGELVSRELESTEFSTTLPGAPDGEYVVIQFATSFESKESAVETITPMKDPDGVWRVSGYFIK